MKQWLEGLVIIFVVLAFVACGSSSGSSSADSTGSEATLSTAKAVPSDVVLSSPTEQVTASSSSISKSLAIDKETPQSPDSRKRGDPIDNSYVQKREALGQLMNGEGDCSFTMQMPDISPPACYGPTVSYENYPAGGSGFLPVGDLGFWNPTEGATEACAAAKMNQLVRNVAAKIDNMINALGIAACAANKDSITLPAIGDTLNLKDIVTARASVTGLTFSTASIKRLANTADGNEAYLSTLSMSMVFPSGTVEGEIILKHIATSADGSTYKGKLSTKMGLSGVSIVDDCPAGTNGTTMVGVVMYEKSAADNMKYEFNYVPLCGSNVDPFDENNNISPTTVTWLHDWNYGLFNLNPQNGTGSAVYAWQAGAADNRTRVFNITIGANSDASASGTAYYGFGPDITSLTPRGTIDGFVCNWAGPGGAVGRTTAQAAAEGKGWNKAQRQELTRAAGATVFSAATSSIKYAPVNSCDTSDGTFTYHAILAQDNPTALNFSNDRTDPSVAIVSDLIDLSQIVFTQPSHPEDVGGSS